MAAFGESLSQFDDWRATQPVEDPDAHDSSQHFSPVSTPLCNDIIRGFGKLGRLDVI